MLRIVVPQWSLPLTRVNDVYNGTGPDFLEVFDVGSGVAPVSVRRVDAFRGEVVELVIVRVHYDLLFIRVLEGLGTRQMTVRPLESTTMHYMLSKVSNDNKSVL